MISCAYCDAFCQPTREHIVPRWYSLTLGNLATFNARQPFTQLKGDLMVKDVCASCNGGVLSKLDAYGKKLYDEIFSVTARYGDVKEVSFDVIQLSRWILKLSFNSGRANGTDLPVLKQYRDAILGKESIGQNFFIACHLIGPSIADENQKLIRPATDDDPEEGVIHPHWFRICQLRLPLSPITQIVQRQILINSYSFSIIAAPRSEEQSAELRDTIIEFRNLFPSAVELKPAAKHSRLYCNWDHAAQSIGQLYNAFPNRFGYESNDYTKRLLREQNGVTILALTRDFIEKGDVQSIAEALQALVRNREMALAYRMRVGIMADGYDDDPRELWEVTEVRDYIRKLFLECPFIMLIAHPELRLMKLFFACWIYEPDNYSEMALKPREHDFITRCFAGNNVVTYQLCISREVQMKIEQAAIQTLYPHSPQFK
jgi:hypothetical protein